MRKSIIITVCAVIAAAVAVAGLRYYITYKRPNIQQDYILLVHDGMTYEAMMDSIISSGAVKNDRSLMSQERQEPHAGLLQTGTGEAL